MSSQRAGRVAISIGLDFLILLILVGVTLAQDGEPPIPTAPQGAVGSSFTYQGQLKKNNAPITDNCLLAFRLYDQASGGGQIGSPITMTVPITNGLFTVQLDFGASPFAGEARWLNVQVRCPADVAYLNLGRQAITAAPHALYSTSTGALQGRSVANTNPVANQVLKWNGSAWVPANDETSGGPGNSWSLTGNAGTNPFTNFLGTTDKVSLMLKVNNSPALRLVPNATSPNLIGGHNSNSVMSSVAGATVGGGGSITTPNRVLTHFGTIGGGQGNTAGGIEATVSGGFGNTASGQNATVSGGWGNVASNWHATVGGGLANTASGDKATIGGGHNNTASGFLATIGGGYANTIISNSATVGGGTSNAAYGEFAAIAGGDHNAANLVASVGGGNYNHAAGYYSSIAGGDANTAAGNHTFIGGGLTNFAGGHFSTIGGGESISVTGQAATVAGGNYNTASAERASIGGGGFNTASSNSATIGGGYANTACGNSATVGGGNGNLACGEDATVGGGLNNAASGEDATVGGGWVNTASGDHAIVGGGFNNTASHPYATIAGGSSNTASGSSTAIGGGFTNYASGPVSTIGGGENISVTGFAATVAGGSRITTLGNYAFVGGGQGNTVSVSGTLATVGGGGYNTASSNRASIGGGWGNTVSDEYATVGGGWSNVASGFGATIPGGRENTAGGAYSFAAGLYAWIGPDAHGSFAWSDSNPYLTRSWGPNEFVARATGGFWFISGLDESGNIASGMRLPGGSSAWSPLSDHNAKTNYSAVDGREVLARLAAIPIQTWNYKAQDPAIRHIGPVAQDFYAAFNVGEDDKFISTVDADGVALASIQGLYQIVQEKDAIIAAQQQAIDSLKQQNTDMEARLSALEARVNGGSTTSPFNSGNLLGVLLIGLAVGFVVVRRGGGR